MWMALGLAASERSVQQLQAGPARMYLSFVEVIEAEELPTSSGSKPESDDVEGGQLSGGCEQKAVRKDGNRVATARTVACHL